MSHEEEKQKLYGTVYFLVLQWLIWTVETICLPAVQLAGRAEQLPFVQHSDALTFQHNGANNAFICSPFMEQQSELMY